MQTAYCLTVGEYCTGKVESSRSVGILYDGPELQAETHYDVKVTVWDNHGNEASCESFFETGVQDWNGAKWIGQSAEDMGFTPSMLGVYKVSYKLKIEEGSVRAGFYFAMDDERLMDRNRNIYGIKNKPGEGYVYLETDISGLAAGEAAVLNIYRPGLSANDTASVPAFTMAIPGLTRENAHQEHIYYMSMVLGDLDIYLDQEDDAHRINQPDPNSPVPPMFRKASVPVNPYGTGSDYVCFTFLNKFGPMIPEGQAASVTDIVVRNYRRPCNVIYSENMDHSGNSQPILRKKFSVNGAVSTARLYVTARGIYEAFIDGTRVADDWFNPGSTQYNKTHMYQAYDITNLLGEGENAIGIMLAEGWWMGNFSFEADFWNYFGDRLSALAKIVICYEDGRKETIVSDETWKIITDGPVLFANFFQGQHHDMIREQELEGFAEPDFDDSGYKYAAEVIADETTTAAGTVTSFTFGGPRVEHMDFINETKLIGQVGPNVKRVKELTAVSVQKIRPGMFIYDMGQNIAGVPKVTIRNGVRGQKVIFRFAEMLYPDSPEYENLKGMLMIENLR
ncbi:MAG: family 78 glycoside hydrolase catalytic domain, partial [Clostridiales bacterium]|nr:family 78 glycoside hydrolase catalytic domain [Candidatus Blautia equi]